jgi:molybdenum-dependent DNA-binding transcriptional regulator ModE
VQIAHHARVGDQLTCLATLVSAQPIEMVMAVLAESRDGASVNAAAKASGINYGTARRIMQAASAHQQRQLVAVG